MSENDSIREVTEAVTAGRAVVLYDEEFPKLGGYICCAGRLASAETVNFMVREGRGLVCLAMTEQRMQSLGIPLMVGGAEFPRRPTFGASIESRHGVTTGISAADRATTLRSASRSEASAGDIIMPGHVFPVLVRAGGVLSRPGLPEAAVDLARLSGQGDAMAMCAILDESGAVATAAHACSLAKRFSIVAVPLQRIIAERLRSDIVVERVAEKDITVEGGGVFRGVVYRNDFDSHEHMALVAGVLAGEPAPLVRVHSQCLTGDVFGSLRCDCGDQLLLALERIASEGRGAVIYMQQEGRGIGLANKIRAYELQDRGRDTVEANLELGFKEDLRDYGITAQIIRDLGISKVRLMTNNPQKVAGLSRYGIEIEERVALETVPHAQNIGYLRTKKSKLGHLIDANMLGDEGSS